MQFHTKHDFRILFEILRCYIILQDEAYLGSKDCPVRDQPILVRDSVTKVRDSVSKDHPHWIHVAPSRQAATDEISQSLNLLLPEVVLRKRNSRCTLYILSEMG